MPGEVVHPPRGFCIGIFSGPNAAMVGPYATEREARKALSSAEIVATGLPEGWHERCGAENGALVCIMPRDDGHTWHDNGGVAWPRNPDQDADRAVTEIMALQAEVTAAPAGQVRRAADGSIAVRTTRAEDDVDAWMITLPNGETIGVGLLTVEDIEPLLRWKVLT